MTGLYGELQRLAGVAPEVDDRTSFQKLEQELEYMDAYLRNASAGLNRIRTELEVLKRLSVFLKAKEI